MSYLSLYRKFRPKKWEDVKGQDAVVKTLKNQIIANKIAHAFLFVGTRGTGKTSIARIFANAINCENLKDGEPCLECEACKTIHSLASFDVREIDAASNNGVDNIREIIEDVAYPPTTGKYKVYIIDEAHMISQAAFNALLKTLEEPPEYVVFILATTEVAKIPITILSRCQRYDFSRISQEEIEKQVKKLANLEGYEIEDMAASYIARRADGAMRDALSLLERGLSYFTNKKIEYDGILEILGAVSTDVYSSMYNAILKNDINSIFKIIDDTLYKGGNLNVFVLDFIEYLRNLLLIKVGKEDAHKLIDVTSENLKVVQEDAKKVDVTTLMNYIRQLSHLYNNLRNETKVKVVVEMEFLRLAKPLVVEEDVGENIVALKKRLEILETQLISGQEKIANLTNKLEVGIPIATIKEEVKEKKVEKREIKKEELPETIYKIMNCWDIILNELTNKEGSVVSLLKKAVPTLGKDGQSLEIMIESNTTYELLSRKGDENNIKNSLQEIIYEMTDGVEIEISFTNNTKEEIENTTNIYELVNIPIEIEDGKVEV